MAVGTKYVSGGLKLDLPSIVAERERDKDSEIWEVLYWAYVDNYSKRGKYAEVLEIDGKAWALLMIHRSGLFREGRLKLDDFVWEALI